MDNYTIEIWSRKIIEWNDVRCVHANKHNAYIVPVQSVWRIGHNTIYYNVWVY